MLARGRRGPATCAAILLTHHHHDHIGGVPRTAGALAGPAGDRAATTSGSTTATQRVGDGGRVRIDGWVFEVHEIPGHTVSHIAFHGHRVLFCGDTLFSLGCGRLFEGTPAQMLDSLDRLAALPGATRVCCGHEYTVANAAFARVVDPDNPALRRPQRGSQRHAPGRHSRPCRPRSPRNAPANPFLRVDAPAVRAAVAAPLGRAPRDRVEAFAELRRWKDGFRA